ncbi:MAG: AbrB/MazE/SpoVT family DNA-binding domain-containing protein [Dermatophilaceae bacterium]
MGDGWTCGTTNRVGPKGQVVIPKELRDRLGIRLGDRLHFWLDGDHVSARPAGPRTPLRDRFSLRRRPVVAGGRSAPRLAALGLAAVRVTVGRAEDLVRAALESGRSGPPQSVEIHPGTGSPWCG